MKATNPLMAALLLVCGVGIAGADDRIKTGVAAHVGPLSASPDGTKCIKIPIGPGFSAIGCENKKTGETSFGVGTPAGSLQVGGRGPDGKNNFVKLGTPTYGGAVGMSGSVKISAPSYTRSGITGATTLDFKR